jgi:hypothetical protein
MEIGWIAKEKDRVFKNKEILLTNVNGKTINLMVREK